MGESFGRSSLSNAVFALRFTKVKVQWQSLIQRDYYEVLGVARTATVEEIKALPASVPQVAPDRHPEDKADAEVKFSRERGSLQCVERCGKASGYRHLWSCCLPARVVASISVGTIFQDFHDIFGDFLRLRRSFPGGRGGGGRSRRARRGSDLRYDMRLTFERSRDRCKHQIKIPRQEFSPAATARERKAAPE